MLKKISLFFVFTLLAGFVATAQTTPKQSSNHIIKKQYISTEWEIIFSFVDIKEEEVNINGTLRFSPVFNFMSYTNYDFNENVGMMLGLGIRNVGFIAKFPDEPNDVLRKFRTYNVGVPIGLKVGNLNQKKPFFLFGGYELEMPFHYKQKYFEGNSKKDVFTGWFTKRVDPLPHALFLGVQLPQGMAIKFKYYLTNFFNKDFTEYKEIDGEYVETKPYDVADFNVFYFTINWYPFQSVRELYDFKN